MDNTNYPDLIITHCVPVLTCHTVPHKYAELLCVSSKFLKT
jgi:hypothetical protein